MAYQVAPVLFLNLLIFLLATGLVGYGLRQYRRYGSQSELLAFITIMLSISCWELTEIVTGTVTAPRLKLLGANFLGTVVVWVFVYAVLWFALAYADRDRPRWLPAVAVGHVVALSLAVIADPDILFDLQGVATRGPVTILTLTFEQWVVMEQSPQRLFLLSQLYGYAVISLSGAVLGQYIRRNRDRIATGQVAALAVGIGTPLLVNGLVFAGVLAGDRNYTGLSFGVTGLAFAVAVFRYRLLRIAPAGRQQVIETMTDPVVMLDDESRVVDTNPAARELVDAPAEWRGMSADAFFEPLGEQAACLQTATTDAEISVDQDGTTRHFDLNSAPIRAGRDQRPGRLLVFREITLLKEREAQLDLMRQIQSRVLRHNLRNDLTVISGYGTHLQESLGGENATLATKITTKAKQLLSVSNKARMAEQLIEGDQEPTELDLTRLLTNAVETTRESFPTVSITLSCPDDLTIETLPAMGFAFENLIENAAEHNQGPTQTVGVTVTVDDDATVVTVTDDGPGLPEHELSVLRAGGETQLDHGSGIGLWVVQWVIDASNATIEFETSPDGTVVTVRIPSG